jgi:large subunit ribosomal protein L5e
MIRILDSASPALAHSHHLTHPDTFTTQVFVRVQKSKAYFSRYQVKFRRRREGKTDYRQRKRLVCQAKNKYQSPKYRLVVRFTNRQVLCQVVYSLIDGDRIMSQASSLELPRYGCKVGLKNYAAAYCTGLLCARRLLQKVGLGDVYEGNTEVDGAVITTEYEKKKYYVDEVDEDKKPFRCLLDVGCKTTSSGCRIFGALKGAADGGLDIPHSEKRFPGYDRDTKEYDADQHRERIFGGHVSEYMEYLDEEDNAKFQEHFASYIAADIEAEGLEDMYEKVHAAIREDPSPSPKKDSPSDKKFKRKAKLTHDERKAAVQAKKDAKKAEIAADDDDDE